jgi:hypothetical protein
LHEKVRIADIIDISMLVPRGGLGTYALQAHFDFVLIDEHQEVVVAIEFDGSGHDSVNDVKKNSICQQANLPLIRVHGFQQVREINAITLTCREDRFVAAGSPLQEHHGRQPHVPRKSSILRLEHYPTVLSQALDKQSQGGLCIQR